MKTPVFFKVNMLSFVLGIAPILFLAVQVKAQSAPGGIAPSYFLKANTATQMTISGGLVSSWDTEVGASYALTEGTASRMPTFNAGSSSFNYNPFVQFDGVNDRLGQTAVPATDFLNGNSGTVFIVASHGTSNNSSFTYRHGTSTTRVQMKLRWRVQTGSAGTGYTIDPPLPTQYSHHSSYMVTVREAGPSFSIHKNSVPFTTFSNTGGAYNPVISSGMFIGANNSSEYSNQSIAEVILYDTPLSPASIDRVESYLALKYGITRNGNGIGANYIASDGTTIFWNNALNAGYNNDITGIGRDDLSGLHQFQSRSVNLDEPVTIGLGSIEATNSAHLNTFSADGSFLTWGNDGTSLQSISGDPACVLNLPMGVDAKIKRVWKTQLTNFTQDVTIGFESTMLLGYTPISNLRLLIDNDGSDWTDATVISGATLNGTRIEFPGVNFSTLSKNYFTLATVDVLNTPLPLSLISFTGKRVDDDYVISWTTLPEDNVAYYVIKKFDQHTYTEVAVIDSRDGRDGHGNVLHYNWTDVQVSEEVNYYQLHIVYTDGKTEFLGTLALESKQTRSVTLYPNPVSDLLTLRFEGLSQYPSQLELLDQQGCVVYTSEIQAQALPLLTLHTNGLCAGFYYLRLTYPDEVLIEKFVKID